MMKTDQALRKELLSYLERAHTHAPFDEAVKGVSVRAMNQKGKGAPYSLWGLLEHMRITQRDMLDFMRNADYKELKWPDGYWPSPKEKATKATWDKSVARYKQDLASIKKIVKDPATDLFAPIPWGSGQTIFREVLQIIDHASYHLGAFVLMRRMEGEWRK